MTRPDSSGVPDKRLMRQSFDRAACRYDAAAVLQREIGQRLLERLDYIRLKPQRILDVGAGTGLCRSGLQQRYPKAQIVSLDIAMAMLQQARRKLSLWRRVWRRDQFVGGDAEHLPFASDSFDLLFSNLAVQWCEDLPVALAEFRRVLKPGGMLLFTTFGPATLRELHTCWAQVDTYTHVNAFIDMHDIGDLLLQKRFAEPVMDMEMLTLTYQEVTTIMRDLKDIGAHNVTRARPRGLTGKTHLKGVIEAYEQFRTDGVLPVSYEVVYGHAWIPGEGVSQQAVSVPVADISLDAARPGSK